MSRFRLSEKKEKLVVSVRGGTNLEERGALTTSDLDSGGPIAEPRDAVGLPRKVLGARTARREG